MLSEQLDPQAAGIENRERRCEEILNFDPTFGDAPGFQERQVLRLFGRQGLGYQPCPEILVEPFIAALNLQHAQCGTNEVDKCTARIAVGHDEDCPR